MPQSVMCGGGNGDLHEQQIWPASFLVVDDRSPLSGF
jgi:hypothetical protein